MKLTAFFSLASLLATATASALRPLEDVVKRDPSGSFSLYDYGNGNGALKMFYADGQSSSQTPNSSFRVLTHSTGLAYFGSPSAWSGSVVTDITCNSPPQSIPPSPQPLLTPNLNPVTAANSQVIAHSSSSVSIPENSRLYVRPNTNSAAPVGFTGAGTTPSDAVTDSFIWYGAWLFYRNGNAIESKFYVRETSVQGVWQLYWLTGGSTDGFKAGNVRNVG